MEFPEAEGPRIANDLSQTEKTSEDADGKRDTNNADAIWPGDCHAVATAWSGRSLGKKASRELDEIAVEDRLLKVFNNLQRHIKSREFTPDGIEIVGMNGRFVYLRPTGGSLTWGAFENDGSKIEVGKESLGSKWDGKVKDMLTRVLANPSERVKQAALSQRRTRVEGEVKGNKWTVREIFVDSGRVCRAISDSAENPQEAEWQMKGALEELQKQIRQRKGAMLPLVFTAPEAVENPLNLPAIFLAGSIDMGKAERWDKKVIESLSGVPCVVINPRRKQWDSSWVQSIDNQQFKEQVEWELQGLENATLIAMCLTRDSKAPISLLELGLHAIDGKMIVFCPDGFYRKGNVDVVCSRYGVPVFGDFDEFTAAIREKMLVPNAIKCVGQTDRFVMASDRIARRMLAREFVIGLHRTADVVTEKGCLNQLTLALCGHGYPYSEASDLTAAACERCRAALAYACGLGYGYSVHSPEWDASDTRCELCEDEF
jgi:hypothetical protein